MWHLGSIHGVSACRRFESSQLENAKIEKVLDGFVSKRPREELVSCSVEVLHGWGLVSLLRPPSRLGAVFFQDQMDGSYISTESFAMETTCTHLPDWTATQRTRCCHIVDIKHIYIPVYSHFSPEQLLECWHPSHNHSGKNDLWLKQRSEIAWCSVTHAKCWFIIQPSSH